jgi:glycosyltransferase involved in cell wall biosynthesis
MPAGARVICTSGRLEREKNLPMLLKAFREVIRGKNAKLLILGDGTMRQELEGLSHELDIAQDVVFAGHQRNPYKFIRASDIFVHTCLFEGFANVIIEAMASRVPVIAVDCPYGPRDIIEHGENGLLVKADDESSLAGAIVRLLGDEGLRSALAGRGTERSRDFSSDRMVKSYEDFFREVAGRDWE